MQENYGVNACTVMSMMSEKLMPSACEVDITGVAAMYALQLASGTPSALVDWNNNYGDDPDKCVFFHCGNWAKAFLPDIKIGTAEILGTILGAASCHPDLYPELCALVVRGELSLSPAIRLLPFAALGEALEAMRAGRLIELPILVPDTATS